MTLEVRSGWQDHIKCDREDIPASESVRVLTAFSWVRLWSRRDCCEQGRTETCGAPETRPLILFFTYVFLLIRTDVSDLLTG